MIKYFRLELDSSIDDFVSCDDMQNDTATQLEYMKS